MNKKSKILLLIFVFATLLGIMIIKLGSEQMKSYLIIGAILLAFGFVCAVKLYNDD